MSADKRNIRIIDIAQMSGVSAGTVDRVLHNRGKVSLDKQKRVEKALKELNYEPNIIARSLAMKRHYTIAAVIPYFEKGGYWDTVNVGIERAAKDLANFNVDVRYFYFSQYEVNSFTALIKKLEQADCDAALIAALFDEPTVKLSAVLDEQNIPYVFIDSNISGQNNIAYFGADSYNSGAVAAKLMLYDIGEHTDIFIATLTTNNKKDSAQTYIREQGFRDYLSNVGYKGVIHNVELSDDYTQIVRKITRLIEEKGELLGGIVFNSRIHELATILYRKMTTPHNIKLLGYDAIEKNIEALKRNEISFLLSQRSDVQGYNGVKALSNLLLLRKKTPKINYMPIDILIRQNVEYYNNREL
ncbi:MAG: LacI family DNA-binding transcriptional regulator [Prevotella sp.]|jgi:LacI family transcriptional regulator|nr:LacI family DNA-binding transcriptional regulator [Prevotella sp.]